MGEMQAPADALWETWRTRRNAADFESLVRPEIGRALAFARSLGCSNEDAEDVLQESLVRLAGERSDAPARLGVRAWFYRTVRDRARVTRRSRWRLFGRERRAARPEAVPPGDRGLALREEVERALRGLSPDDREAVTLHYLQDLDYRDLSLVLGASENACRIRVHRALERLRATLGPRAATMIAAVPLPMLSDPASLVQAAIAGVGGTGAAAGATGITTGGVVMASGTKVAVAAAVGATVLAGGAGYFLGTSAPAPAPESGGRAIEVVDVPVVSVPAVTESPVQTSGTAPVPASLSDLAPTSEEMGFLRDALAAERVRRKAATLQPGDGGLETMDRVRKSGADATALLWDWTAVRSRIRTGEGEQRSIEAVGGDGPTPVNLAELAGKSAVIRFGPGTFRMERKGEAWNRVRAGVRSLEIRGAGMDATTLQMLELRDLLLVLDEANLENLVIADLTFDAGGGTLLDVRGRVSVAIESVRFRNSQHSAGHAAPIGISGESFLGARGCEFLGPGDGFALSVRGPVLALFEECRFEGLEAAMVGTEGADGSVVHLLDCTFEGSPAADSRMVRGPGKRMAFPVRVRGGRANYGPPEMSDEKRKERWGLPFVAEATGVTFGPSTPSCTLGLLLSVLDRIPLAAEETILGIRVLASGRSGPETLGLVVRDRATNRERHLQCRADGAQVSDLPRTMSRPSVPSPEQLLGALPLTEVIRASGLSVDIAAISVAYGGGMRVNEEMVPSVSIGAPPDWPSRQLDARNGKDYFTPK